MEKKTFILSFVVSLCIGCSASMSAVTLPANEKAPASKDGKTIATTDSVRTESKQSPEAYEKYTGQENYFSIVVPRDWKKKEKDHPYGDLTKISGITVTGPKNKDGVSITLSVLYYGGEGIFTTAEAFIRGKLNSTVRIDYDTKTAVTDIVTAGRKGKKFQIRTFEIVYLPVRNMPPAVEGRVYEIVPPVKRVNMIQEYCVIPAKKGFYVLLYGAPEDVADDYRGVFEKMAGSFEPHLP